MTDRPAVRGIGATAALGGARVIELPGRLATRVCGMLLAQLGAAVEVFDGDAPAATDPFVQSLLSEGKGTATDASGASMVIADASVNARQRSLLDSLLGEQLASRVLCTLSTSGLPDTDPADELGELGLQARAGVMAVTGEDGGAPSPVCAPVGEMLGGLVAATASLAAWRHRRLGGQPQRIDLSLLEVGDVAHPLLQELVRRAPGTYNHSINVASLAEAAAESIGGRGLLVRVGAYFHDIGKMLKPSYFVENQGQENRHESLVPAMSTLIIVAHVKEGVELARQYNLPQPIIDLIAEHHGTTLVEYFYKRAAEQSQADPHGGGPDEHTYRYPGPKPSTRESAVMMLADAAESASRSLSEPTPARIASLVNELAQKRLNDGQFDECGLTLEELKTVEKSLVKSLTAVYHGRVKYPDQRTA